MLRSEQVNEFYNTNRLSPCTKNVEKNNIVFEEKASTLISGLIPRSFLNFGKTNLYNLGGKLCRNNKAIFLERGFENSHSLKLALWCR